VFLRSLTIKGFKSFADTTVLDFEPGVTVVVGPNGSGKSNVVDAVAWVLGAQGPRTLRSTKMEDVIFAGTPKRTALGRAEVSLTIDNSAGLLPIEFSEVTITRTLFRSGESEYAINRVPCRLLDIQDLLSDSGVGRQQHVIVSQGNLDAILNARPEERRLVIEEAAGILKFRRRKEKAERRLESTEASLVRLQDLLREVRRQLRPLEKQAEAARRHGDVVTELAAVRRHLFGRELAAVESRLTAAGRERIELRSSEGQVKAALSRLDADVVFAESRLQASLAAQGGVDLAEMVSRAEGLRARSNGLTALIGERRRSLERAMAATVDESLIASLETESAALADQLAETDAEAASLLPQLDELTAAETELVEAAAAVEAEWGAEDTVPGDPAAEVRGELNALRAAMEQFGGEMRRLEARSASVAQRADRQRSESSRYRATRYEAESSGPDLARAEETAVERERRAEAGLQAADEERSRADGEQHRWEAREEALAQALDRVRARAGVERLAGLDGVVGTLVELVDVDPGFEAAFEAAAGEVLAAVFLENPESARRGLEELHRLDRAGAVVALPPPRPVAPVAPFPVGPAPFREAALPPPPPAPGSLGPANVPSGAEAVRAKVRAVLPSVRSYLDSLLKAAVVVGGGWREAVDLAILRPDLVVVTRAGDRCSGGLWQAGAAGSGATAPAWEEARRMAGGARSGAEQAAGSWRLARQEAEDARNGRVAAGRAVEANAARLRAAVEAFERIEGEIADSSRELETVTAQRRELERRLDRERERIAELEGLLPELESLAAAEAERAAAERMARFRLAERTAALAAMRRELEVRSAGLEERRNMTAGRLHEVEARLERNVAERAEAAARRRQAELALAATDRLLSIVRNREPHLDLVLSRLRDARRAESAAIKDRTERLEELRRHRSAAERELTEIREKSARAELEETEGRMRLEGLTESVRRDLDCEPEAVRQAPCPELPPGTSATSRRTELERELRLMGPINPLALEEHTALFERHQFLETQLEDVRNGRRELSKVVKAIDAEIIEVFGAAFADVADNFENLFATLFPGGEGRLRLTDPDRLLETGIEVEARPSGKNLRRLSLLSGGERSLAALAFLFAVFRARPSPFYMMDEVEAALDDVNLHRFLDLIGEFRDEAQLLIVSHQKRTMEAADCLYGVTMAPGDSSRVISERIAQPTG
jgi:chromosome segregation protein